MNKIPYYAIYILSFFSGYLLVELVYGLVVEIRERMKVRKQFFAWKKLQEIKKEGV